MANNVQTRIVSNTLSIIPVLESYANIDYKVINEALLLHTYSIPPIDLLTTYKLESVFYNGGNLIGETKDGEIILHSGESDRGIEIISSFGFE